MLAEPTRDRTTPAAHLQASPVFPNADGFKSADRARIEDSRKRAQTSPLILEPRVVDVFAHRSGSGGSAGQYRMRLKKRVTPCEPKASHAPSAARKAIAAKAK